MDTGGVCLRLIAGETEARTGVLKGGIISSGVSQELLIDRINNNTFSPLFSFPDFLEKGGEGIRCCYASALFSSAKVGIMVKENWRGLNR